MHTMVPTYATSFRNTLSSFVPNPIKHFLVAKVLFGPTTGKLIRLLGPARNLKGIRFDVNSANLAVGEVANLYFNRRERAEFDLVRRHILRSDVTKIVELGASIGFIASNLVHSKKIDYLGVEGSPRLTREARVNVENNNRTGSDWRVENFCIDYSGREHVEFAESSDSLVGQVGRGGNGVRVPAVTLGELVRRYDLRDFALIADIEGAEDDMLFRDASALEGCKIFVVELEDTPQHSIDDQVRRAEEIGFELRERFRNVFAFVRPRKH